MNIGQDMKNNWIYCNDCGRMRCDTKMHFAILKCRHVFCQKCFMQLQNTDRKLMQCSLCNKYKEFRMITFEGNHQHMQYFNDKAMQDLKHKFKCINFQGNKLKNGMKHIRTKVEPLNSERLSKLKVLEENIEKLQRRMHGLDENISKWKKYYTYLSKK